MCSFTQTLMTTHHPQVFRFPFRTDNAVEVQANLEYDGLTTSEIVTNTNQKIVYSLIHLGGQGVEGFFCLQCYYF